MALPASQAPTPPSSASGSADGSDGGAHASGSRPLRIAHVSLHTSPLDSPGSRDAGGMNVVEVHQALALASLGHRVDLFTRRDSPDAPAHVDVAEGVVVRLVDAGPPEPLAKSAQERWIGDFGRSLAQLAADQDLTYDVVHSQHWMSGVAAIPVAQEWGVPHVQSFHSVAAPPGSSLSLGEPPESPGRPAGERLIAQQSDLAVAVSEYEARTIIERCGADPGRVRVLHPGVDTQQFHPLSDADRRWTPDLTGSDEPQQYGPVCVRPNPNGYVLFAARLQPLKAPDLALVAIAGLPPAVRPTLVIAGEASQDFADYRQELIDLAQSLGTASDTCWLGSQTRDDLSRLMRGARAMLVPSFSETFGLVALEASASGIPVIAADSGGLREVVDDGRTGIVVGERSADAWTAALAGLLADPARAQAMGRAGRAKALGLTWDDHGRRLAALYQEALVRHAGGLAGRAAAPGSEGGLP